MQPWWERWQGRLECELQAFVDADLDFVLDEEEKRVGRILIRGNAPIADRESTEVVIVYPDTFPNTRFAVFAPKLDLPRHQNPIDRNLCMLPRGSENWRPEFLAADFVGKDLPELVALVRAGGVALHEAEDPQGEPLSEFYHCYGLGGIIVPASTLQMKPETRKGRFQLRFLDNANWLDQMLEPSLRGLPDTGVGLLSVVSDYSGQVLAEADAELKSVCEGPLWWGNWVRFDEFLPASNPNELIAEIVKQNPKLVKRKLENSSAKGSYEVMAAVFKEEVQHGAYEDMWIFCLLGSPKGVANKPLYVNLIRGLRFSKEDLQTRVPELKPLSSKGVSIIGLGTLGAPVAIELAKAQVGQLDLADDDYLNAGTIVRWPYGLSVVGADKPVLMRRMLQRNYPYTQVRGHSLLIGRTPIEHEGQSEGKTIDEWLSRANLVIDATAESNVSRSVCDVATPLGIPQIYLWSIDGYGGVVARIVPRKTGCFHCLEIALSAEGHIQAPKAAASSESLRVQPKGCADPTFTGSAVDLLPLSNQAARLAFGSLCAETVGGYPDTESDVFVLQLRNPDGSLTRVPEWRSYNLPANPECTICFPVFAHAS